MGSYEFYLIVLLIYLGTNLLAVWGLNLEFGVGGVANLAFIVVVAVGAYTYSVLTLPHATSTYQRYVLGLQAAPALAFAGATLTGAGAGILIGVTGLKRLRQDYQAMVMLVVALMALAVVEADKPMLNGFDGLSLVPNPFGPIGMTAGWPYVGVVLICCAIGYVVVRRFTTGPMGRTLRAMRDEEHAVSSIGKSVVNLRLLTQGVGGAFGGLSGALLVAFIGGWAPSAWAPAETLALLSAAIVGGLGSDLGAMVGTLLVTIVILQGVQFLPEVQGHTGLKEALGWVVLGVLIVGFVWVRPRGLVPERRPRYAPTPVVDGHIVTLGALVQPDGLARPDALLEVEGLERRFGGVMAVDRVSFGLGEGEILGLIGPNGAGKSTVLNLVSGFLAPTAGRVRFTGRDVTGQPMHQLARRGLIRTFQLPREFRGLTTLENLLVAAPRQRGETTLGLVAGRPWWAAQERENVARARELLHLFGMADKEDEPARNLSGGQKRAVEIMRALMARPRLLLLDEPMAGLSPSLSRDLEEILLQLREAGLSMLLVEHELGAVERLCAEVVVMAQGRVLSVGSMAELRSRQEVQDAYIAG